MRTELNGLFLNEIINALLCIILVVLYINSLLDRRKKDTPKDKYFSLFILFCAGYLGMMLPCLYLTKYNMSGFLLPLLTFIRVLLAILGYSFFGTWLVEVIDEKKEVAGVIRNAMRYGAFVLFAVFLILCLLPKCSAMANIPIFMYYFMLQLVVLIYRNDLGRRFVFLISLLIIPELILQVQEWWNYTLANIYLVLAIMIIYSHLWTSLKEEYMENKRLLAEQNAMLENARTRIVLSQIKPHFMYNTMSTITYLCRKDPEKAEKLSLDFTTYLRGNLSSLDSKELIPFEKEFEHIKTYLKIELVRFEDTLKVEYDIKTTDFKIPVLTVEPLVENAVKHGVCEKDEGGTVTIRTREEMNCFKVTVEDNGIGFNVENLNDRDSDHIGLVSVRKRIEILSKGKLIINSKLGEGTIAIIEIPKSI